MLLQQPQQPNPLFCTPSYGLPPYHQSLYTPPLHTQHSHILYGQPFTPSQLNQHNNTLMQSQPQTYTDTSIQSYRSIIQCGRIDPATNERITSEYAEYFGKIVDIYTAVDDVQQRVLYRASTLAEKFNCATNKLGMYLARRRQASDGIYQSSTFRSKTPGKTGLKSGGYFLTIDACKEFENHFVAQTYKKNVHKDWSKPNMNHIASDHNIGSSNNMSAGNDEHEHDSDSGASNENSIDNESVNKKPKLEHLSSAVDDKNQFTTITEPNTIKSVHNNENHVVRTISNEIQPPSTTVASSPVSIGVSDSNTLINNIDTNKLSLNISSNTLSAVNTLNQMSNLSAKQYNTTNKKLSIDPVYHTQSVQTTASLHDSVANAGVGYVPYTMYSHSNMSKSSISLQDEFAKHLRQLTDQSKSTVPSSNVQIPKFDTWRSMTPPQHSTSVMAAATNGMLSSNRPV